MQALRAAALARSLAAKVGDSRVPCLPERPAIIGMFARDELCVRQATALLRANSLSKSGRTLPVHNSQPTFQQSWFSSRGPTTTPSLILNRKSPRPEALVEEPRLMRGVEISSDGTAGVVVRIVRTETYLGFCS